MTARYHKAHSLPAIPVGMVLGKPATPKSFNLTYLGNMLLDRRITKPMLRWILVDIKKNQKATIRDGAMVVNNTCIKFTSTSDSSDVILEHNVHGISSFTRCQHNRKCFFYLQRNSVDCPLVMFAFLCEEEDKVVDLFHQIQDAVKSSEKPVEYSISGRKNQLQKTFEVRYQGRCFINDRKKSGAFIDSWLMDQQTKPAKSKEENGRLLSDLPASGERQRHASDSSQGTKVRRGSSRLYSVVEEGRVRRVSEGDGTDSLQDDGSSMDRSRSASDRLDSSVASLNSQTSRSSSISSDMCDETDNRSRKSNAPGPNDLNKTMLLQIDDERMSIISLDTKSNILEKTFKEISYCTQGAKYTDHFGFICFDGNAQKERRRENYVLYIFQCASETVISEVMDTLRKAFESVLKRNQEMQSCEYCPMQQYHKLCEDLSYIKDSETAYNCIQNHILNLQVSEYSDLMNKVKAENCTIYEEANDVLMTKLRIICEIKQLDHVHGRESEFNIVVNRQSKLNIIRNRAKKALVFDVFNKTKSQDNDWRPKSSTSSDSGCSVSGVSVYETFSPSPSPTSRSNFTMPSVDIGGVDIPSPRTGIPSPRPRSRTLGDSNERLSESAPDDRRSFLQRLSNMGQSIEEALRGDKFASPDKSSLRKFSVPQMSSEDGPLDNFEISGHLSVVENHRRTSSWRRGIFESVVTTPKSKLTKKAVLSDTPVKRSLGKEELRGLWRSAIEQIILLNRMEKENKNLQESQEKMNIKREQLNYKEVTPCHEEITLKWKSIFNKVKDSQDTRTSELWSLVKEGPSNLKDMVKTGVPRSRRGSIWQLLANQYMSSSHNINDQPEKRPEIVEPYKELLHGLTPYQHAILIDLGRTFPQHPYFQRQLGAGQLTLFNVLKAYSLVDDEVGYCQGLGFVAGILLMHLKEEDCFEMLSFLMYDLGLRRLYKPDMVGLQVAMYQLARLLRDKNPEIYQHLEDLEITPAFYAAPWFITLFSSTFPIGFVARVFDFLFMEGFSAIFKIALALISTHEKMILESSTFESASDTLKYKIPNLSQEYLEAVFKMVPSIDLKNDLYTYQVEYYVFQEDANFPQGDVPDGLMGSRLEHSVLKLREQNTQLLEKLSTQTHKLKNQETMIDVLKQTHAKTNDRLRALETQYERQHSLILKLAQHVPDQVLQQLEEEYHFPLLIDKHEVSKTKNGNTRVT